MTIFPQTVNDKRICIARSSFITITNKIYLFYLLYLAFVSFFHLLSVSIGCTVYESFIVNRLFFCTFVNIWTQNSSMVIFPPSNQRTNGPVSAHLRPEIYTNKLV